MCGCIYGLTWSLVVLDGLVRSHTVLYDRLYDYTRTWHPCQFFKSFKNHTRLSRIHSNGPSLIRIRPRLVRLYARFTRMANRISRVFCVRQVLHTTTPILTSVLASEKVVHVVVNEQPYLSDRTKSDRSP